MYLTRRQNRGRMQFRLHPVQEELAKEAEAGAGGRGGLVLMGPALIPQDLHFLVVYVFSAQGLPGFSSVGVPAVNALVQVRRSSVGGYGILAYQHVVVVHSEGFGTWRCEVVTSYDAFQGGG